MYEPSFESFGNAMLSAVRLRELIRGTRAASAPDHVARTLRHRLIHPVEDDARELGGIFATLIGPARERLRAAGVEPVGSDGEMTRLPKREMTLAANLAVLLTYAAITGRDDAMALAREGLDWAALARDDRQTSVLWRVIATLHPGNREYDDEERAYRKSVEAARRSCNTETTIAALGVLGSMLVVRWRLDEAEEAIDEAIALLRAAQEPEARLHYPQLLMNRGRIELYRTHYSQGIQTLREALRWCGVGECPTIQTAILTHLGSVYLRLEQYQQSIECQREVVQMAEAMGSRTARGWGYFRLAEAHLNLGELGETEEALNHAWNCCPEHNIILRNTITGKRAAAAAAAGDYERAEELCRGILIEVGATPLVDLEFFAYRTLGDINERRNRYEAAAEHYQHAVDLARRSFPPRAPQLCVALARTLHALGRPEEAEALLDDIAGSDALNLAEQLGALRVRASLAEGRGDVRAALDLERQAMGMERELMERQVEQTLRNTRIMAETDLLQREAELERARRARLERELSEAMVELGDRRRFERAVERKLRDTLQRAGAAGAPAVSAMLHDILAGFGQPHESSVEPAQSVISMDPEFLSRLRTRWPDLTRKQERLCGLIRSGLQSREIAALIGVGQDGVKAQRKRLRKKLGLAQSQSLETMMAEL